LGDHGFGCFQRGRDDVGLRIVPEAWQGPSRRNGYDMTPGPPPGLCITETERINFRAESPKRGASVTNIPSEARPAKHSQPGRRQGLPGRERTGKGSGRIP
jgi:hypothetical protein